MKNLKKRLNHSLLKSYSNLNKKNKNSFYLVVSCLNDVLVPPLNFSALNLKTLILKNLKHLVILPFLNKKNKHFKYPIFFKLIDNISTLLNIVLFNKKLIIVLLIKNYLLFKKNIINIFLKYFNNKIVLNTLKLILLNKIFLSLKFFISKKNLIF